MSNEITKEPEIRFDGYEGDWEQRKLGELSPLRGGFAFKSDNFTNTGIPIVRISNILADGSVGGEFAYYDLQRDDENYSLPDKSVLLAMSGATTGKVAILENPNNNKVYQNQRVGYFTRKQNTNYCFISVLVRSKLFLDQLNSVLVAGAQPNVSSRDIDGFEFFIPSNIEEQQKIGTFFKQLDDTIALHQRELDLLEQTKQTYLKKMFPKTGEDKPEICFAGFTDAWEQRMLGDVFSERSERSSEGELISVTINSGVVKASELDRKDNSSNDKSNYKKVEVGDIAYNSMRMWQGASGYSSYDGILSPAYTVIIPKEGIDSKFFAYDFKRHDMIQTFKRNSQGLTSDTWNLKFPTLKSVKVMVPCMEEQTKISNFFERLDTTITLHQRELDSLKEIKKTLLQKMFV
ncbi:TPA: restriction endonuclease subunit S [Enterococcus faecium]|nr:restriction endonuclease subunit S [Enterococcus faecium]